MKLIEYIEKISPFIAGYPNWFQYSLALWVMLTALMLIGLVMMYPKLQHNIQLGGGEIEKRNGDSWTEKNGNFTIVIGKKTINGQRKAVLSSEQLDEPWNELFLDHGKHKNFKCNGKKYKIIANLNTDVDENSVRFIFEIWRIID